MKKCKSIDKMPELKSDINNMSGIIYNIDAINGTSREGRCEYCGAMGIGVCEYCGSVI